MRKLGLVLAPLIALIALVALAPLALAVGAGGGESLGDAIVGGPLSVAPIALAFATLGTVLLSMSNWLPGWATKLNIAAGMATAIGATLAKFGETHPKATIVAIFLAGIGAVIGYHRSEARAAAR